MQEGLRFLVFGTKSTKFEMRPCVSVPFAEHMWQPAGLRMWTTYRLDERRMLHATSSGLSETSHASDAVMNVDTVDASHVGHAHLCFWMGNGWYTQSCTY